MRLIDAGALIGEMHNIILEDGEDRRTFYEVIERQPTIEERKKGEWEFPYTDKRYKKCSVCGREFYSIPHTAHYCPSCGADMRGDNDA